MTPKQKPKTWKAWGVFARNRLQGISLERRDAKWIAEFAALDSEEAERTVRPVTITLVEKKARNR